MSQPVSNIIKYVKKRDFSSQKFDSEKISNAIYKAMLQLNNDSREEAEIITKKVIEKIENKIIQIRKENNNNDISIYIDE